MKILLVADIHSNWPALQAVNETFDACLVLGDIVDYGTDPGPCVDWVRRNATYAIRGNHDHAVVQQVVARGGTGLKGLAAAARPLQRQQLDRSQLKYLSKLPVTQSFRLEGLSYLMVHATPRDPLDEYLANDADIWREILQSVDADVVCVGHTHLPFELDVGKTKVVNPGSVGQPRDGDPRCSYAVIEDGKVGFHRVEYDIGATITQMRSSGLAPWAVQLADSMLRTGCRPLL
ncbi:MAG: phosphodiesterase [Planctomycetaceae bacterium]|nr:phosphodiesterase [Planctomycetaceae bacterium]